MAEVTIKLVSNPQTGKRDIIIDYESEEDALPHEHEHEHKAIIEQLLGQGILSGDDIGNIRVGRQQPTKTTTTQEQDVQSREAQEQGS